MNFNIFGSPNKIELPKDSINEKFDEFIKDSFHNYLKQSNVFNKFSYVYDNEKFTDECSEIYILSQDLYSHAIKKFNLDVDKIFNYNSKKLNKFYKRSKITPKKLYIFDLKDIHNHNFLYKTDNNSRIFKKNKKKILCKIISLTFIKLYILIKGIYNTFNIDYRFKDRIKYNIQNSLEKEDEEKLIYEQEKTESEKETAYEPVSSGETASEPVASEVTEHQPVSSGENTDEPEQEQHPVPQQKGGFIRDLFNNLSSTFINNKEEEADESDDEADEDVDKDSNVNLSSELKEDENQDDKVEIENSDSLEERNPERETETDESQIYNPENIFYIFMESIFEDLFKNKDKTYKFPENLENFTDKLRKMIYLKNYVIIIIIKHLNKTIYYLIMKEL